MIRLGWRYGLISLAMGSALVVADDNPQSPAELGRRIYREGLLTSGQPLQGELQGGLQLTGDQAACVKCHRRSGLGSIEGGRGVLPVTGGALYQPGPAGLWQKFDIKTQTSDLFRPAYDDASLGKAIRDGVTSSGRALRPPMPHFNLGEQDMGALIAYLKSLGNTASPGVDDTTMHLATVVTPDADPAQRQAMLEVIEAFLKDKNSETRHETRRRETSKEVMYTSYRKLDWQVWQLQGPAASWEAQLLERQRQQPVFALVSGLSGQDWTPVHAFCEQAQVACLFPNTDTPQFQTGDFYNIYFSRGLLLEADALAKQLATQQIAGGILQVFRDGSKGQAAASQLQQALQGKGLAGLKQRKLAAGETADTEFWNKLLQAEQPAALVLWLGNEDLAAIDAAAVSKTKLYLSASLIAEQLPKALSALKDNLYLLSTWDTPRQRQARVARTRVWMQTRKVPFTHEVLQANTFWSLLAFTDAAKHLAGNFSTDYLIERTEDMTESAGVLSIYPHLSLGPGQRFAAKSAQLWKLAADGSFEPASDWMTP